MSHFNSSSSSDYACCLDQMFVFCSVVLQEKVTKISVTLVPALCATRVTLGHGSICHSGLAAVPSLQAHSSGLHSSGQFPRVS